MKLLPHEQAGRLIRLLGYIVLIIGGGLALALILPSMLSKGAGFPVLKMVFLLFLISAVPAFLIYLGGAVKRHEPWARVAGIIYGVILLGGFPIGTIPGIYILWSLGFNWNPATVQKSSV